jgi:hypothetical protein
MATSVTVGGMTWDLDDPCATYAALRQIRLKLIAGESISEVQAGDANAQRRVRYNTASVEALDRAIAEAQSLCSQSDGGRPKRYAMRAGFRKFP